MALDEGDTFIEGNIRDLQTIAFANNNKNVT
jgi:hypothetical protein